MIVFVWTEIKIYVYYRLRLQSSSCGRRLKVPFNSLYAVILKSEESKNGKRRIIEELEESYVDTYFTIIPIELLSHSSGP